MKLTDTQIKDFQETVYQHYREHGRDFPWRNPSNSYEILVSEVMLQQTQADRVVPYYERFMDRFPDIRSLSQARLSTVLKLWQGLGYNRRAKLLHEGAKVIVREHGGSIPTDEAELVKIPGIGPYTAAAITAFAGNQPTMVIETNIRSVYINHFFGDREGIPDKEITPLIEQTLNTDNPRAWYSALMDYGAMLKRTGINPSRRSAHYARQSAFKGSNREARGAVLGELIGGPLTISQLLGQVTMDEARVRKALKQLEGEGFVRRAGKRLRLA